MTKEKYLLTTEIKVQILTDCIPMIKDNKSLCYSLCLLMEEELNKTYISPEIQVEFDMHKVKPKGTTDGFYWWPMAKDLPNQWVDLRCDIALELIGYWKTKP